MEPILDSIQHEQPVTYAGFWMRFVAVIIDGIAMYIIQLIVMLLFFAGASFDLASIQNMAETGMFGTLMGMYGIIIILNVAYYAGLESSRYQATLGKMALGIKVTTMQGQRISFANAVGRYFAKIISVITLMIGYIVAGFTEKKQALHDYIAGTLVVKK